ncbi:hypothetical protein HNP84_000546 [Thermocatellispora tengchongensis]|uniref:NAD(P)-binding domain-containing protein n=1 Tax=Thermocatellispora tengchongensis TaxID=1073253 RepID=A0A840NTF0_9ACTN|nr:NAD(P)H-binding protein [Thermocatellispora tengchongensis]MBB5130858.1 hypothetical protein [Thermocatellispora tengchongensis]
MTDEANGIVVFGAGGRAGRRVVEEAAARGRRVTAVVRDVAKYRDLGRWGAVVAGDVTDPDSVAAVAAGHAAAVNAAARLDVPSAEFFVGAARALLAGLERAGVGRLVTLGIGTTLETAPGVRGLDDPALPEEARAFSLGHAEELEAYRKADTPIDWLMLVPPPALLDPDAPRTGRYRIGGERVLDGPPLLPGAFAYADLAVAVVDEITAPRHHRAQVAVGY